MGMLFSALIPIFSILLIFLAVKALRTHVKKNS